MNIIVAQDKSVRLTQYSNQSTYSLDEISFYLSKGLELPEDVFLSLEIGDDKYTFYLAQESEVVNYYIYKINIIQDVSLSANAYNLVLLLNEERISLETIKLNKMSYKAPIARFLLRNAVAAPAISDQHKAIEIEDRTIKMTQANVIIAEDNNSQCITFKMSKTYDGIDLYEDIQAESKNCFIDYVLPNDESKTLYNLKILKTNVIVDPEDDTKMLIKWLVSYNVTQTEGTVQFAISICGIEEGDYYIWQTAPANLVISPNLHKRNESIVIEPDNDYQQVRKEIFELQGNVTTLQGDVATLDTRLDNIETSDVLNADDDGESVNYEVLFSGGGAPV